MEAEDKVVLHYFYKKVKERIRQMVREEIRTAEYNAKHLVGGLGPEKELSYFEDLLQSKMERARLSAGGHYVPVSFTLKELQRREFDTPFIRANRREVYESGYRERQDEFIDRIARSYYDLDIYEYLRNRIVGIRTSMANTKSEAAKKGHGKTSMVWLAAHRRKLKRLHASLVEEQVIGEIDLDCFRRHFAGVPQEVPIDFLPPKALVFYLLDRLKNYITADFYTGSHGTSSPTAVSRHFVFKGKPLKDPYSVKSKGHGARSRIHRKRIDLIVSSLAV